MIIHRRTIRRSITKELLSILGHQKVYHCLIDYGSKAIRLEPGIQDAYYWVIVAAEKPEGEMWRMIIESRAALEFSSRPGQKTVLDKMRYNSYNSREGVVLQERNHSV